MRLYSYYRSSASYRVRIALAYKNIAYDYMPIHLLQDGGQQFQAAYTQYNPSELVPTLLDEEADVCITQSLAMLEYLEERFPEPAILPEAISGRAYVRSIAAMIACDVHPLDNLRVLTYLKQNFQVSDDQKNAWYLHWIEKGFCALEKILASSKTTGLCCYGDTPTLADMCLIPQLYNAKRFNMPLKDFPHIMKIADYCEQLDCFQQAKPESQPDAPK